MIEDKLKEFEEIWPSWISDFEHFDATKAGEWIKQALQEVSRVPHQEDWCHSTSGGVTKYKPGCKHVDLYKQGKEDGVRGFANWIFDAPLHQDAEDEWADDYLKNGGKNV